MKQPTSTFNTLPKVEENVTIDQPRSISQKFLDFFQEIILPSITIVSSASKLFASRHALEAERERQMKINRWGIHPMSKLRSVNVEQILFCFNLKLLCLC